ncbi:MAG TPA: Ig-like domain-containing protein [Acidimicrobiia bacterium]
MLVAALAAPSAAGAAGGPSSAPLAPADGALFGAAVAPGAREAPYQPVADLEGKLGRRLAIDRYDRPFGTAFPDGREQWDIDGGRIPMISWGPVATGEVNRGSWDTQVRLRARGIKNLGQLVLVSWFADPANPHNTPVAGNASQYVAAWRRIRRIFAEEDARNAVWVWCADAADFAGPTADTWYPGDDSVDWTCADGYNPRNPARPDSIARSFEEIFAPFHDWGAHHDKPMMVGRYGTAEDAPGDKPTWVDAARQTLKGRLAGIDAVVYDSTQAPPEGAYGTGDDWRMDSSDQSMAAFAAMGADPWFTPAVEKTLPDTVIDSGPERTVASHDATFGFSASGNSSGFECHLDRGAWQGCTSPHGLTGLPDGRHSFEVRAVNPAGRPDPTPARREWTVDTTGPEVMATSPKDKATNAPPGAEVTATFSEAVDPSSVTDDTFTLVVEATGDIVTGKVSYDPATRKARLRPDKALLPLAAYRATVGAAVKDLVGNPMTKDHAWSFQTTADTTPPGPPSGPEPGPAPGPSPPSPSPPTPNRP